MAYLKEFAGETHSDYTDRETKDRINSSSRSDSASTKQLRYTITVLHLKQIFDHHNVTPHETQPQNME